MSEQEKVIKLADVAEHLKQVLATSSGDIEFVVEEPKGILVDYTITKHSKGYDVVFDDRDLTLGLDSEQFSTAEEMISYFDDGNRKPMVLDSLYV